MSEQTSNNGSPGGYQGGDPKAQAKAEKAYRKALRPFYKKKRFIIPAAFVVVLVVAIAASSAGGKKSTSSSTASGGKPCAATYLDKQKKDVCANASGTVAMSSLTVQASALKPVTDTLGGKALCSSVVITNKSSKSQDYNIFDFKIQTPSGAVDTSSAANLTSTLDSGALVSGGVKRGKVCMDAKGEKGQYVMIYKPDPFSSARGVWLSKV